VPEHVAALRKKVDTATGIINARIISLTRDINSKKGPGDYEYHMKEIRYMVQWERFKTKLLVCTTVGCMIIAGIIAWLFTPDQEDCEDSDINSSVHELE